MGTHYKQLINPDYMGSYSLDNGNNGYNELAATLKHVKQEEVISPQGKKSTCLIGITDQPKPFILNRSGQKVLVKLSKSRYIEDWKNLPITFWVECNVKAYGEVVDGLRIKERRVIAPTVNIEALKIKLNASKTLDELKINFSSLKPNEQALMTALKDELKNKLK